MADRGQPGSWHHLAQWADGEIDLDETLASLPASDRDMARLFLLCWPEQVFSEPAKGRRPDRWLLWDGTCQRPDTTRAIERKIDEWTHMLDECFRHCHQQLAVETERAMAGQPRAAIDAQVELAWQAWTGSKQHAYARGLRGMSQMRNLKARIAGPAGTDTDEWPASPLLINTADCVVSLDPQATGFDTWPHHPSFRMTYCLSTPWRPPGPSDDVLAGCPRFRDLLYRAVGYDEPVFWYLLHALGYSLAGHNRAQLIFFLSGPAGSGKSAVLEAVSTVLEQLAHEAMPELVTRPHRGDRHGRHNASIRGKRFVTIGETNASSFHLDENQIKLLTGQSHQSVDVLYETELMGAVISALIFIGNNTMPDISDLDDGMARRLRVIPMGAEIPIEEQITGIGEIIGKEEAPGILSALVWACRKVIASDYQLLRLPPPAVVAETERYKREQDTIALWLADNTWPSLNGSSPRQQGSEARRDYVAWCAANDGRIPESPQSFYAKLSRRAGIVRTGSSDQAWFYGFVLKNPGGQGL